MGYKEREDLIATMRRLGICVLIPTYNNAGTVTDVISDVLEYTDDVIVVNDGSTDTTSHKLSAFGDRIKVVAYSKNRGKGFALKTGFKAAKENGYKYAITLDSDGQHYAENIPDFVRAIAEHPGALIVGERDLTNVDINGKSSFANKFSNFWFTVQTGRRLRDTQTGYRAYPLDRLYGLGLLTSRYEAELELLVFASWHGVEIVSIPIRVYYPPQSERISHFRPGLDFTRISILNTILCGGAVLYGLPVRTWNLFAQKRLFGREMTFFTRKRGEKKEAATTLGRLGRSIYGLLFFLVWSMCVFRPFSYLYFKVGKNNEEKKYRYHKILRNISATLTRMFPGCKTTIENPEGENFERPALIICNHQSHLDLPVLMSVHPKMIFLTNDWVWNNPFYGGIIHKAEYLPVSRGIEEIIPQLKDLRDRGYSIVVFPEGTRSADCSILRFHQGAFMLGRELNLDIVPMVLHGAGHYLPKKDFMFRRGEMTLRILPRVKAGGAGEKLLREEASQYRKLIKEQYNLQADRKETADYFRSLVLYKYAYRGWKTVSECKKALKEAVRFENVINGGKKYRKVRIINSGIGIFSLLYALVNKNTEVYAFESNEKDWNIASETADLPSNLHYIHAVWESEFGLDEDYDLTIVLSDGRGIEELKEL